MECVGRAVAKIAVTPAAIDHNYHLVHQDMVDWSTVVGLLTEQGHSVDIVPYAQWLELLRNSANDSANSMLSGLLPLIPEAKLSGPAADLKPLSFACNLTDTLLSPAALQCPTVSRELIATYVEFLFRRGVLASTEVESPST